MKKFLEFFNKPWLCVVGGVLLLCFVIAFSGSFETQGEPVHGPSIFCGILLAWSMEMIGGGICASFDARKSSGSPDDDKSTQ